MRGMASGQKNQILAVSLLPFSSTDAPHEFSSYNALIIAYR